MSEIDDLFLLAGQGEPRAFEAWMGRVERPIRASLSRFARAVDVEGVVQETLLRMWHLARDEGGRLSGENASLRFAIGMAKNIARNEARRMGRMQYLPPEDLPEPAVGPDPTADPALLRLLKECLEALTGKPREVLRHRLTLGSVRPDRELAVLVGMTFNTFLQNLVRARKQLRECLERKGVPAEEIGA